MAAKILKIPLISVMQADQHPANKGLIWWKKPPDNLPSALPAINKVLTQYDLNTISKVEELSLGDLTLIVGSPETDPIEEKFEGIYIGSILWQSKQSELPIWLNNINDNKPLTWVYSGNPRYSSKSTVFDSEIILSTSIQALAGEDMHVLITTGHHALPDELLPLPNNFNFEPYVPGLSLADRCDLMIHHGGYGSCQTGLYSGTPSVIIPTFSERESNARRIAALGAGDYILPETDPSGKRYVSAAKFKNMVKHVLNTSTFRERAEFYSKKLKSYGGVEYAVQLIETFTEEHIKKH
jgi:UDP:flavonoid glycosyltransferase YjiC (YdhE family)